jgi:hypothetical protein
MLVLGEYSPIVFLLIKLMDIIVLHPYYKLEYIKMTWGGHKEQEHEHMASNLNAKDWHDEALKVVETTMKDYWKTCPSSTTTTHPLVTALVASTSTTPSHDTTMVESAFGCHCRLLLERQHWTMMPAGQQNSGGTSRTCLMFRRAQISLNGG